MMSDDFDVDVDYLNGSARADMIGLVMTLSAAMALFLACVSGLIWLAL